jgi:hypothetical protein
MTQPHSEDTAWRCLVESHLAFATASKRFLSKDIEERVELIRNALKSRDRLTAIYMLRYLQTQDLQLLFPDLVFQASFAHGGIKAVREAILSLPKDWVLENIEVVVNPLLCDEDSYRRILELYSELDDSLAEKLAEKALKQEDRDVKEAGLDFLRK